MRLCVLLEHALICPWLQIESTGSQGYLDSEAHLRGAEVSACMFFCSVLNSFYPVFSGVFLRFLLIKPDYMVLNVSGKL